MRSADRLLARARASNVVGTPAEGVACAALLVLGACTSSGAHPTTLATASVEPPPPAPSPSVDAGAGTAAGDPPSTEPEPAAASITPGGCVPEVCLAGLGELIGDWVVLEELGVPDPDSVPWGGDDERRAYLDAAGVSLRDVPRACRAPEAECNAAWDLRFTEVVHPDAGCPRARYELQLVLFVPDDDVEHRLGAPFSREADFVGAEDLDTTTCTQILAD